MQGFAPRKHPRQACSLDCIAKLRFAFQPAFAVRHLKKPRQPARSFPALAGQYLSGRILYRAPHFPVVPTYLPTPAGQHPFVAYLPIPEASQSLASQQSPFRLDRPTRSFSHSFSFSFSFFFSCFSFSPPLQKK